MSNVEHSNRISRLTRENRFRRSLTSRSSRAPKTRTKPNRQKRPGKTSYSQWLPPLSFLSELGLIADSWYGTVMLDNHVPLNLTLVGAAQGLSMILRRLGYITNSTNSRTPRRRNLGARVICLSLPCGSCPWQVSLSVISTSPIAAVGLRLEYVSRARLKVQELQYSTPQRDSTGTF
jgi:hypothetical protein